MMAMSDMIDVPDLHAYLQDPPAQKEQSVIPLPVLEADSFAVQERLLVMRALETAGGNQTQAARILRISRDRLRYKIKKHNLDAADSGRASTAAI